MFLPQQILKATQLIPEAVEFDIPCYAPRSAEEKAQDKYENVNDNIDFYTWLAYGSHSFDGLDDSIYSKIAKEVQRYLQLNDSAIVLDVGCGVGRTIYDCSEIFKDANFIGFDYSINMLKRAQQILTEQEQLEINLSSSGFPNFSIAGRDLSNVYLVQGSVLDLPFKPNSVDAVVNTFLIDRVQNVKTALEKMIAVLKPGGLFILASPLNFQSSNNWKFGQPIVLVELLKDLGIEQISYEDNISHKEVLDARGNHKLWNTLMLRGKKVGAN